MLTTHRPTSNHNSGFSLLELIVVIAILAVLTAVITPVYMNHLKKARQSKVLQEANAISNAVRIAMIDTASAGDSLAPDQFQIVGSSGLCGRITNWVLIHSDEGPNKTLANFFKEQLNLSAGASSAVPISSTIPNSSGGATTMSLDEHAIFQILYDSSYNVTIEYNRNGYFVRISGGEITCTQLTSAKDSLFTRVNQKYTEKP